jgi:hypothetical protein
LTELANTGVVLSINNSIADTRPHPRGKFCPSFASVLLPSGNRGRREDRVPAGHPRSAVRECEEQMHSGIQVQPNNRPSLRSGFTAYVALSPGSDALLPPSPCRWLRLRTRSGRDVTTRLDAQTPGVRTTRFCRTQAAPVVRARQLLTV